MFPGENRESVVAHNACCQMQHTRIHTSHYTTLLLEGCLLESEREREKAMQTHFHRQTVSKCDANFNAKLETK